MSSESCYCYTCVSGGNEEKYRIILMFYGERIWVNPFISLFMSGCTQQKHSPFLKHI